MYDISLEYFGFEHESLKLHGRTQSSVFPVNANFILFYNFLSKSSFKTFFENF